MVVSLDPEIPSGLKDARRRLENIVGYELVRDLYWNPAMKSWIMQIRLSCNIPANDFVPDVTEWHVIISPSYPEGGIRFYPDKKFGIQYTFEHQNYNHENPSMLWRSGDPCLNTSKVSWGRKDYSVEPRDSNIRLRWHVLRCMDWIYAAGSKALSMPGDPFEFPSFPSKTPYRIVFNEDPSSFQEWVRSSDKHGTVELKTLGHSPEAYAIFNFLGHENNPPNSKWGNRIASSEKEDQTGIWLMLDKIPIAAPWQIPLTFSELNEVCEGQSFDLKKEISGTYLKLRKKNKYIRFIVIGFPIPKRIGESPSLIHWFAFELSNPSKHINGFQRNSEAQFVQELNILMSGDKKIKWVQTENWNKEQLTARGLISPVLAKANILLIGAGAVGSVFADQLIRLGCEKMKIIDSDILNAGNMSRHTLSLLDVGKFKSQALSNHLNTIFPFVTASFETQSIQDTLLLKPDFLSGYDIIVDATADDNTLHFLSDHLSHGEKIFISLSTGYNANRLFCLIYPKNEAQSIEHIFRLKCDPWLQKESAAFQNTDEIVEGVGCWHPLFPSRVDDLQMLIGASVKIIESDLIYGSRATFTVVEKQYDLDNSFVGVRILKD